MTLEKATHRLWPEKWVCGSAPQKRNLLSWMTGTPPPTGLKGLGSFYLKDFSWYMTGLLTASVILWYSNWFGSRMSSGTLCPCSESITELFSRLRAFISVPDKAPRRSKGKQEDRDRVINCPQVTEQALWNSADTRFLSERHILP